MSEQSSAHDGQSPSKASSDISLPSKRKACDQSEVNETNQISRESEGTSASAVTDQEPEKKMTKLSWAAAHAARAWKFYESLGSPKYVVAPMVDQSEHAFRALTRQYGAHLCYTPMYNSSKMVHDKKYMQETLDDLSGYNKEDHPLFVQICGHKPDEMLVAAKAVENRCDAVDINLGCPQLIARRGRYGAFLLEEFDLLEDIVTTLSCHLDVPVTCKIRILPSFDKTIALAKLLQRSGCSLLTVHGRTKEEKGSKIREANWDWIRQIKEQLDIPVFANGSIGKFEDIQACMDITKCDGVMSSEGVLENPALFEGPISDSLSDLEHFRRKTSLVNQYLDYAKLYPPRCDKVIKKHVMSMVFGGLIHNKKMIQSIFTPKDIEGVRQAVDAVLKQVETTYNDHVAKATTAATTKVKDFKEAQQLENANSKSHPAAAKRAAIKAKQQQENQDGRHASGLSDEVADEYRARFAVLPNKEGRWYWRYRVRQDAGKRKTFKNKHTDRKNK